MASCTKWGYIVGFLSLYFVVFVGQKVALRRVVVHGLLNKAFGHAKVFGKLVALTAAVFGCADKRGEGNELIDRPLVGGVFVLGTKLKRGVTAVEATCHTVPQLMSEALKAGGVCGGL